MSTTERDIHALGSWFYDFELPGGIRTNPSLPEDLRSIHADRLTMLNEAARVAFPKAEHDCPLAGRRVLDVGCHEGFFSHRMLDLGAESAVGVDVRETNIRKATLVGEALGADRVSWLISDAEDLVQNVDSDARFDLTLAYGLLYHCENPIRVLRQIAAITTHAIVIETQLSDELGSDRLEWGRRGYTIEVAGAFAVVDESRLHPTNNETGASPLALCPSENALRTVLAHCGFGSVVRITPPDNANEQLLRGKRGVFLATPEGAPV